MSAELTASIVVSKSSSPIMQSSVAATGTGDDEKERGATKGAGDGEGSGKVGILVRVVRMGGGVPLYAYAGNICALKVCRYLQQYALVLQWNLP